MSYFTWLYSDINDYTVVEHDNSLGVGWNRNIGTPAQAATYAPYTAWLAAPNTPAQSSTPDCAGNPNVLFTGASTVQMDGNTYYVGGTPTTNPQAAADAHAAAWAQVRAQRNTLITATDWSQMVDAPISSGDKTAMAQYRQQLRDLPQTTTDPTQVVYPPVPVTIKLSINNQATGTITPAASASAAAQAAADSFTGSPQWTYLNALTSLIDQDTANAGMPIAATSTASSTSITVAGGTTAFPIGWAVFMTGTVPGGFTAKKAYYVVGGTSSTVQLSVTPGGSAISATSTVSSGCNLIPCWVPPQFTTINSATFTSWYTWGQSVLVAFEAYVTTPTTANLAALQTVLGQNPTMNL